MDGTKIWYLKSYFCMEIRSIRAAIWIGTLVHCLYSHALLLQVRLPPPDSRISSCVVNQCQGYIPHAQNSWEPWGRLSCYLDLNLSVFGLCFDLGIVRQDNPPAWPPSQDLRVSFASTTEHRSCGHQGNRSGAIFNYNWILCFQLRDERKGFSQEFCMLNGD